MNDGKVYWLFLRRGGGGFQARKLMGHLLSFLCHSPFRLVWANGPMATVNRRQRVWRQLGFAFYLAVAGCAGGNSEPVSNVRQSILSAIINTEELHLISPNGLREGLYNLTVSFTNPLFEQMDIKCNLGSQLVQARIDNSTINCTLDFSSYPDGVHTIGMIMTAIEEVNYTIGFNIIKDATPPTLTFESKGTYEPDDELVINIADEFSAIAAATYRFNGGQPTALDEKREGSYVLPLPSALATGRHRLEVWAMDMLGNQATMLDFFVLLRDTPTVIRTSAVATKENFYKLAADINSGTYEGTYKGGCFLGDSEELAHINLRALSCVVDLSDLADGNYNLTVALTADYNKSYDFTFGLLKDTTAPIIDLTGLAANYQIGETISVVLRDELSALRTAVYRLNGGLPQKLNEVDGRYEFQLPHELKEEQYNLEVRAVDALGNEQVATASFMLSRIRATLNWLSESVTTDNVYRLRAEIDSDGYRGNYSASCSLGDQQVMAVIVVNRLACDLDLSSVADGNHNIEVTLMALYGEDSFVFNLLKDSTGPTIDLTNLVSGYKQPGETVEVTLSDVFSDIGNGSYRLDDGAWKELTETVSGYELRLPDFLTTGRHNLTVRAVDILGNEATARDSFVLLRDAPMLNRTSALATREDTYRLTANLNASSYTGSYDGLCSLGSREVVAAIDSGRLSCALDLSALSDGNHSIEVSLTADYGKRYSFVFVVLRDKTGPVIDLTDLAASYAAVGETIVVGISDSLSGVAMANYSLNGADGQLLVKRGDSYSFVLPNFLATGRHNLTVRAVDTLGNEATASASFVLLRDAPMLNRTSALATREDTYRLTADLDSGSYGGSYDGLCSLGSREVVAAIDSERLSCVLDLSALSDGNHSIEVSLTADYGKRYSFVFAVLRDKTGPVIDLTDLAASYVAVGEMIAVGISDNLSGLAMANYSLDGGSGQPLVKRGDSYSFVLPDFLATGRHSVTVRAVDMLGNEATVSRSFVLLLDSPRLNRLSPAVTGDRIYTLIAAIDSGSYRGNYTARCKLESGNFLVADVDSNRLSCRLDLYDLQGPHSVHVVLTEVDLAREHNYTLEVVRDNTSPSIDLSSLAREYNGSESVQRLTITDTYSEIAMANWTIGGVDNGLLQRIGGGNEWGFTMPVALLPTGRHQIEFAAVDDVGNTRVVSYDFLVLKDEPTIRLTSAAITNLNSYNLVGVLDSGSYLGSYSGDCLLEGKRASFQVDSGQLSCALDLSDLMDGERTVHINLTADYGRSYILPLRFVKDTTAPSIVFSAFQPVYETSGVTIAMVIEDEWSAVRHASYQLDNRTVTSLTRHEGRYELTLPPDLATGRHSLTITVADDLGNERVARRFFVFLRDAPQLIPTSKLITATNHLRFTAAIDAGSYSGNYNGECNLASGGTVTALVREGQLACDLDLTGLMDGHHPFTVVLTADYNRDYQYNLSLVKDSTPPDIRIQNLREIYVDGGAQVDLVVVDSLSGITNVTYQLNHGVIWQLTVTNGSYQITLPSSLSTNRHWLTVTATNELEQKSIKRSSFLILRDAPQLRLTSPLVTTNNIYHLTAAIDPGSYPGGYDGECSFQGRPSELTVTSNQLSCMVNMTTVEDGEWQIDIDLVADYGRTYEFAFTITKERDIDDDDDGLIEIRTLAELNAVRYQLDGSGKRMGPTAALHSIGCPVGGCRGYELMNNISLAGIDNWVPIGYDESLNGFCRGEPFSGTFAGNGWTISELRINRAAENCAGFFGSIDDGEVDNLNIRAAEIEGDTLVGVLAGQAFHTSITNISVSAAAIKGMSYVGGLVGSGVSVDIVATEVMVETVQVNGSTVGGLVGSGVSVDIVATEVMVETVQVNGSTVGGLVGSGTLIDITSVEVMVETVQISGSTVGGLIGQVNQGEILSAKAVVTNISGKNNVSGLMGWGESVTLAHSYALLSSMVGENSVGGLVGYAGPGVSVLSSYAVSDYIAGRLDVGGLIGHAIGADIASSYALSLTLRGGSSVGGLVGTITGGSVISSYALGGSVRGSSDLGGLVGQRSGTAFHFSYWDQTISSLAPVVGESYSQAQLQSPTAYEGIYADWDNRTDLARAVWCDSNLNGAIDAAERRESNKVWDFGTDKDYPALRCTPEGSGEQRARFSYLLGDSDNDTVLNYLDVGEFGGVACRETADCDRDGVGDPDDAFPLDPNESVDTDRDGIGNNADVDDDNDGLIEIRTLAELNAVRYQLDGSGTRTGPTAALHSTGCPADGCRGYELMNNISLAAIDSWVPVGYDESSSGTVCRGAPFSGTFAGNGWTISELRINRAAEDCAGFFGSLSGEVDNLNIRAAEIEGNLRVGVLAGRAFGADIINTSVSAAAIKGESFVGGLIGSGTLVNITSAEVIAETVQVNGSTVGGLIGQHNQGNILSSKAVVTNISGQGYVGGLMGRGAQMTLAHSFALTSSIVGDNSVGGLVGQARPGASVLSSYAVSDYLAGQLNIGGLVGHASGADIASSYALSLTIEGGDSLGGLVGAIDGGSVISSYALGGLVSGGSNLGGLAGRRSGATFHFSYWDQTISSLAPVVGESYSQAQLRSPTAYEGIYADWDDRTDLARAVWCDSNLNGAIDAAERKESNKVWDFGTDKDYPTLHCTPDEPDEQRARLSYWLDDSDNDTVLNYLDVGEFGGIACRETADCDRDGVGDPDDAFPLDPNESVDTDKDSIGNNADLDDDRDGLIEIRTLAELDAVRYQLDGSGTRTGPTAALYTTGCPVGGCRGYELMNNISLAAIDNWIPIGYDESSDRIFCPGEPFNGTFAGNGWTISELRINRAAENCAGFFGSIRGEVNNLNIRAAEIEGDRLVGVLAGRASYANITNISVSVGEITGKGFVGGLIGAGNFVNITSAEVIAETVQANGSTVGGLVGNAFLVDIASAEVMAETVRANGVDVGGLIGEAYQGKILSARAVVTNIGGQSDVGGLVGGGVQITLMHSFALTSSIVGESDVGGLVGSARLGASVLSSYAASDYMAGQLNVGGLIGYTHDIDIASSYAFSLAIRGGDSLGGLVGAMRKGSIISSYAFAPAIRGGDSLGGLVGTVTGGSVISSYALNGLMRGSSNLGGLAGQRDGTAFRSAYWDQTISSLAPVVGESYSQAQLQSPTAYEGIYADWDNRTDLARAVWCDSNLNGAIDAAERKESNKVWDFGTDKDYPTLHCTPDEPDEQRVRLSYWLDDSDNDTVLNYLDLGEFGGIACRETADCDRDGVGDPDDAFPLDPNESVDTDKDGIGNNADLDDDNDTILDQTVGGVADNCRLVPNPDQQDSDNDSQGDLCDADDAGDEIPDLVDNCPLIFNPDQRDTDGDGTGDLCDLDRDGNGLIEVATARQFNAVRYQLDGSGYRAAEEAPLRNDGCLDSLNNQSSCHGYELVAHINLSDYSEGLGWQPIGHKEGSDPASCDSEDFKGFNGTLQGNGWTISGLSIARPQQTCVGLFKKITGRVYNLSVVAEDVRGYNDVGVLAGRSEHAEILFSSTRSANLTGQTKIGGLFGSVFRSKIFSSFAVSDEISVTTDDVDSVSHLGGLVGSASSTSIISSYAIAQNLKGNQRVGGLVGFGNRSKIRSSFAISDSIAGSYYTAGLIGYSFGSAVLASPAVSGSIQGTSRVGGLMGYAGYSRIFHSAAISAEVNGTLSKIGGLVGLLEGSYVSSSYAAVVKSAEEGSQKIGGLIGVFDRGSLLAFSYWDSSLNSMSNNSYGIAQTNEALRRPIDYGGIYAYWSHGSDIDNADYDTDFNTGIDDITRWCDTNGNGYIDLAERQSTNLIWDFGSSKDYPVVRCLLRSPSWLRERFPWEFQDNDKDGVINHLDEGEYGGI